VRARANNMASFPWGSPPHSSALCGAVEAVQDEEIVLFTRLYRANAPAPSLSD
jgi:hypothetical protein